MTEVNEAGRHLAADLANAEHGGGYNERDFKSGSASMNVALARLATQSIARDAELAEAKADLREIDQIAMGGCWDSDAKTAIRQVATIAAKHRETDPLVAEAAQIVARHEYTHDGLRKAVAEALKRGIELKGVGS